MYISEYTVIYLCQKRKKEQQWFTSAFQNNIIINGLMISYLKVWAYYNNKKV